MTPRAGLIAASIVGRPRCFSVGATPQVTTVTPSISYKRQGPRNLSQIVHFKQASHQQGSCGKHVSKHAVDDRKGSPLQAQKSQPKALKEVDVQSEDEENRSKGNQKRQAGRQAGRMT
eukprot:1161260-Pelagomonas_calceolata.AAC.4